MSKPYIDNRLEIRHIPEISGWGVFTREKIKMGAVIEIAPVIVYPRKLMEVAIWSCQAEGIPNPDLRIDQYTIDWLGNGAFPLGWAGIYNHSDNNNCQFIADYERSLVGIITLRPIEPEEQLCVSYGETWFKAKGYIKKYPF